MTRWIPTKKEKYGVGKFLNRFGLLWRLHDMSVVVGYCNLSLAYSPQKLARDSESSGGEVCCHFHVDINRLVYVSNTFYVTI